MIGRLDRLLVGAVARMPFRVQTKLLAAFLAIAALLIAWLLTPAMPMRIEVSPSDYIALPIVAIAVGLLASLFGLRRAVTVDPAMAFGGA